MHTRATPLVTNLSCRPLSTVKPANVLMDRAFQVKLCDFGIARLARGAATLGASSGGGAEEPGGAQGTDGYMAPEAEASHFDFVSDVFPFGTIMWQVEQGTSILPLDDHDEIIRPPYRFTGVRTDPVKLNQGVAAGRSIVGETSGDGASEDKEGGWGEQSRRGSGGSGGSGGSDGSNGAGSNGAGKHAGVGEDGRDGQVEERKRQVSFGQDAEDLARSSSGRSEQSDNLHLDMQETVADEEPMGPQMREKYIRLAEYCWAQPEFRPTYAEIVKDIDRMYSGKLGSSYRIDASGSAASRRGV